MAGGLIQPDLFDRSRRYEARQIVQANINGDYQANFYSWLHPNWMLYLKFERMALHAIRSGRKNYSAKTIIEVLRWASDMRERDSEFKINNNWAPDLAQLFEDMNPDHRGFFRHRIRRIQAA